MNEIDALLVRVLAAEDAVRLPIRQWNTKLPANRAIALRTLDTHGPRLTIGGSALDRKTGERLVADAEEAGLLAKRTVGRSKFSHFKLSLAGEFRARALAAKPLWEETRKEFLEVAAKRTRRDGKTVGEVFVDEIDLNGGKGWGLDASKEDRDGLGWVELLFAFAAARGWATCKSTILGHVRYRVLPAGWMELDNPARPPAVDLQNIDDDAVALYRRELSKAIDGMEKSNPDWPGEIGELPMPLSHVGLPVDEHCLLS